MPSWCHCHSLSLASVKSRLVFTFLVPAHPGSPGKRAVCVLPFSSSFVLKMRRSPLFIKGYLTWLDSIVLFFSRPRSEGWPHHERTFSIYRCPLSFWLTLPRGVLSTSWCCPATNSTVCSSISIEINISMYSFSRVNGNKFLSCFLKLIFNCYSLEKVRRRSVKNQTRMTNLQRTRERLRWARGRTAFQQLHTVNTPIPAMFYKRIIDGSLSYLNVTVESKKQDTKLLLITLPNFNRFSKFSRYRLIGKFATKSYLYIPPRFYMSLHYLVKYKYRKMASFWNTYCKWWITK